MFDVVHRCVLRWYKDISHAAELTAGYFNVGSVCSGAVCSVEGRPACVCVCLHAWVVLWARIVQTDNNDAYANIASMFSQYGVTFCFTCLEMQDSEQPASCSCGPFELVEQTKVHTARRCFLWQCVFVC